MSTNPNGKNSGDNHHPAYYANTGGYYPAHYPTSTPPVYYSPYQYQMPPSMTNSANSPYQYQMPPSMTNSANAGIYGIPSQPSILNLPNSVPMQQYLPSTHYPIAYYAAPYAQTNIAPTQYTLPPPTIATVQHNMPTSFHAKQYVSPNLHSKSARGGYRQSHRSDPYQRKKHLPQIPTSSHDTPTQKNPPTILSCEACHLEFSSEQSFQAHMSSHICCSFPGCSFSGSRKVVSGHYSSIHGKFSGRGLKTVTIQLPGSKLIQRFKICVGNHPEDVKAWIEERKKKYPTIKKVSDHGEKNRKRMRIKMDESTCSSSNIFSVDAPTKRHKAMATDDMKNSEPDTVTKDTTLSIDTTVNIERSAFASLLDYGSSSSEDDEEKVVKCSADDMKTSAHNVSENTSLVKGIDSDIEPGSALYHFRQRHCKFFVRAGSCKNGPQCAFIHDSEARKDYTMKMNIKRQEQSERDKAKHGSKSKSSHADLNSEQSKSLLRKLLDHDMRRERCLSLQLLRYLADSNYMQPKKVSLG